MNYMGNANHVLFKDTKYFALKRYPVKKPVMEFRRKLSRTASYPGI